MKLFRLNEASTSLSVLRLIAKPLEFLCVSFVPSPDHLQTYSLYGIGTHYFHAKYSTKLHFNGPR